MKNKLAMLLALNHMNRIFDNSDLIKPKIKKDELRELRRENQQKKEKGLNLFNIGGITVWALNKKSALKKVNKMKIL